MTRLSNPGDHTATRRHPVLARPEARRSPHARASIPTAESRQARPLAPPPVPFGLTLEVLLEDTVNEIIYSGIFRHLAADDLRSEPRQLWTTNANRMSLEQAQAPHQAEIRLPVHEHATANALALWFSAELAPGISLSVGPGDPPTHWGMTTAPLRSAVQLTPGMTVRATVTTAPAQPMGTLTRWAIALPGANREEHDEQSVWEEIDD